MVEGQIRGQIVDIKPLCHSGIVAGLYAVESFFDYAHIYNGDLPAARVTAGFAECVQLFEVDTSETGFFLQFPCDGIFQFFIHADETAGDGPLAFEWFVTSFNKQELDCAGGDGEDYGIDSHHWSWPVVNVFSLLVHIKKDNEC